MRQMLDMDAEAEYDVLLYVSPPRAAKPYDTWTLFRLAWAMADARDAGDHEIADAIERCIGEVRFRLHEQFDISDGGE